MNQRLYRILAVPASFGVLLSLLGASFPASAASAGAPAITARISKLPLDKEFARARELGRPVFAFLHTEWCQPCHWFIRETLPRPEVQTSLGRVHFVSYDAERGAGREVAQRLGVHGFPSFILFDNEGTICRRITG
jgi:thiol:disulfide interchange protein